MATVDNAAHRDSELSDGYDESRLLPVLLRLSGVRRSGTSIRVFSAWLSRVDQSKALKGAAARVRTLIRRDCIRYALMGWLMHVEWLGLTRAATARVERRQARLHRALTLSEWRHVVHWRVRWRTITPCITRKWRTAVLRDVTFAWHTTTRRVKTRRGAADNFKRRRNNFLLADYLLEWSQCASGMAMRTKILDTTRLRCQTAALRAVFLCWGDMLERAACLAHAATVVCRRRDNGLLWDAYHRWSDWSYTSRQHRRAALRAFDRMRASTATNQKNVVVWQRLSEAWLEAAAEEMKDVGNHLRGHIALALQRGISRSITKLLRSCLREWSYFRRNNSRLQEAAAAACRRTRARTCAAILEAWNALLDRKSFLSLVHTRIHRRTMVALLHSCMVCWREFSHKAQRCRNRLRRLRRRVLLRAYSRIVRQWQVFILAAPVPPAP